MNIRTNVAAPLGLLIGLVMLAFTAVVLAPSTASAATKDKASTTNQDTTKKNDTKQPDVSGKTYEYVAQPSDSYTKMARKAVQTYGIVHKVNLSSAQIIFAETNITKAASWPLLSLGQKVTLQQTDVQNWIQKAQELTDSQVAAWQYYVQFVDFNTNGVGESRSE